MTRARNRSTDPAVVLWRATVTPLASIVGSGFLVVAPLLGNVVGAAATCLILVGVAIALVWLVDVFEIIALASRAFALYYLAQVLVALQAAHGIGSTTQYVLRQAGFGLIAAVLLWIVIFAIPVQ